jgi:3-oxoacyl-(acyl-carrier-protein) synthase
MLLLSRGNYMRLPVIVGMGGVNAAGRTSGFQSYRRMVIDSLDEEQRQETLVGLAVMMGLVTAEGDSRYRDAAAGEAGQLLSRAEVAESYGEQVLAGTLVRKVEPDFFDVDALHWQSKGSLNPDPEQHTGEIQFVMARAQLPHELPDNWSIEERDEKHVLVTVTGTLDVKLDNVRDFPFKAAGQLPSGFDISELYNSRFQPRGLQMTLFGATDALRSVGIEWDTILEHISPDQVGVYSSSGFGQMDQNAYGGMHQARMKGDRVTTKALTMGINSMPTDFINAYVLANLGIASSSVAACATFLSNLRHAVSDMQTGKIRVAMVGNSEAPICPELMDGFGTMGALATDENMMKLYGGDSVDHRRASRPFGDNCGFTIGEASQYFILMDDTLAVELGAPLLGAVTDVFIDADGIKKSITAPGPGNHITMAKAAAATVAIAGEEALQKRSFVMAHGSSTPQNRVTESQILDQVATAFDIQDWPVVAVKAFLGHTIAPASGDQLAAALGEVAILNSKGFGGNNASAVVLSPVRTEQMLATRHGETAMQAYREKREQSTARAAEYCQRADLGDYSPIYRFGEGMIADEDIDIGREQVRIKGQFNPINLPTSNPYEDMS